MPGFHKQKDPLKLECTNCGGVLKLEDRTHAVCPYCGRRYLIDEAKGIIIHVQMDYSGNEAMRKTINRSRNVLVWFLAIASFLVLIMFGFHIAAKKSVFSTSDEDMAAGSNGELFVIFCTDIFGKSFDEITEEELGRIRYLRCSYEREGDKDFNVISYSYTDYQDCADEREFQKTVKKWTYRTRMVSWPSDYSMFTGLTRIDTTGSAWLSMLHFAPENQISYVETEDSLDIVAQVLNPKVIKILHIGAMGLSLENVEAFTGLEELKVDTTLSSGAMDVRGIEKCRNLKRLRLSCKESYTGLDNLKDLPNLVSLYIDHIPVGDCSFLKELSGLEELSVWAGEEPDLEPLKPLTNLKRVYFIDQKYIPIEGIRILQNMTELEELMISVDERTCLEELANMVSLKALDLHMAIFKYQVPTDVSVLAGLTNLERIQLDNFYGQEIMGVEPILNLPGLRTFRLGRITSSPVELILDTEALKDNPSIEELGFTACHPEDAVSGKELGFGFLEHYPQVKWLYLDDCGVRDISFAKKMEDLRGCSLKRDPVEDLKPVLECRRLEVLSVDEDVAAGVEFPPQVQVYTKVYEGIFGYSIFD